MIALEAKTDFEAALKSYLDGNITEALTAKINSGVKTLTQCANFIIGEMKKKAKDGCTVATDTEVYGLAVHFFEEDEIKASNVKPSAVVKTQPKAEEKPKKDKEVKEFQLDGQMSIFDIPGVT